MNHRQDWVEKEKKSWANLIETFQIEESENGMKVFDYNGELLQDIRWNEKLNDFIKNEGEQYHSLYTYFHDMKDKFHQHIHVVWEGYEDIEYTTSLYYDKIKCSFDCGFYFVRKNKRKFLIPSEIDTELLVKADQLNQRFYAYVEQDPAFRIKIAIKEIDSPFKLNEICEVKETLRRRGIAWKE